MAIPQAVDEPNLWLHPIRFPPLQALRSEVLDAGPGTFLRKAELRVNDRMSDLDELIRNSGDLSVCSAT